MIIVGLTGGIAAGKTTIINFLKKKKIAVHESDDVVKQIYLKPSTVFLKHLKKIGLSNAIKKNKIDKNIIRNEIFENQRKKKKLEYFIHNEVRKSRDSFIKKQTHKKTKIIVLDIPLLYEAKLSSICDYVILLVVNNKIKIERATKRKGVKKAVVLKILKNQLSDKYKKKRADFIINTSKTKNYSFKMISNIINNILNNNA